MRQIRRVIAATGLVLAIGLALAAPAGASYDSLGWFSFGRKTNVGSTIYWEKSNDGHTPVQIIAWPAGAGTSTDECWVGKGWIPQGWFDLWGHWDTYNGKAIYGRLWRLSDKTCANGSTRRTDLFIHTEQTADNQQNCSVESQCWNNSRDYYSLGCIKVSYPNNGFPNTIHELHWQYHYNGGSSSHGAYTLRQMLVVFNNG